MNNKNEISVNDLMKKELEKLAIIWETVGLSNKDRVKEIEKMKICIKESVEEFLQKQRISIQELREHRGQLLTEFNKLSYDLSLPNNLPEDYDHLALYNQVDILQKKTTALKTIIQKRTNQLNEIMEKITKVSYILAVDVPDPKFETEVPSQEELGKLRYQLEQLENEHKKQMNSFKLSVNHIKKLAKQLEYVPENEQEKFFMNVDPDNNDGFIYSSQNMADLSNIIAKLDGLFKEYNKVLEELLENLYYLYKRMNVGENVRKEFQRRLYHCVSLPQKKMLIVQEIEEYELLKRERLETMILNAQEEIRILSDKLSVPCPSVLLDKDYNDQILDILEHELTLMKSYYNTYKEVFVAMKEWKNLLDKLNEFEKQATNPKRFNNRGGILLKLERERKLLNKKSTSMMNEIKQMIRLIESNENNLKFDSYGLNIDEWFENIILNNDNMAPKNNERHIFGSKFMPPIKKKRSSSVSSIDRLVPNVKLEVKKISTHSETHSLKDEILWFQTKDSGDIKNEISDSELDYQDSSMKRVNRRKSRSLTGLLDIPNFIETKIPRII